MQNLQKNLIEILKNESTYFSEDRLLKNKLTEDALKLERRLIKYILSNNRLKKHFFLDIDGVLVFDKDKFIQFMNNKRFLPDSYTSFKNRIGLLDENGDYFKEKKDVVLVWPYKDCVLEGGQDKEDEKRNEIFYNEILAPDEIDRLFDPKVLTNFKCYDGDGEHPNPEISRDDNLIIKGNNLLALHSLKKRYRGKVKLIYIDPPFNTDKPEDSFQYNDKFNHSTWLTFMKNRLQVAKELLTNDGFMFVHLDDNEVMYCKVLMDELFGRDNYKNTIALTTNEPSGFKATGDRLFSTANHILVYTLGKTKTKMKKVYIEAEYDRMYNKVLKDRNAPINQWKWEDIGEVFAKENDFDSKQKAKEALADQFDQLIAEFAIENAGRVFRTAAIRGGARQKRIETIENSKKNRDRIFIHPGEDLHEFYILNGEQILFYDKRIVEIEDIKVPGRLITDIWTDISWTGIANEGGVTLKNGKKPEKLMARIIEMVTKKGDYVLDFFAGSGTTAAVAHKTGRRYIGIEQLDYGENDSVSRLKNVIKGDQTGISKSVNWKGGGSFIYAELKKWNQAYIDKIEMAKTTKNLLAIYEEMKKEAFFRYDVYLSKFDEKEFEKLEMDQQKKVLIECLDKNHLYVNLSEIDDATYEISEEDKEMNRKFYGV